VFGEDSYSITDLGRGIPYGINNAGEVVALGTGIFVGEPRGPYVYSEGSYTFLGVPGRALCINENGAVAGFYETTNGVEHAFLYKDGVLIDLGDLGGGINLRGLAINASDQVVGYSYSLGPDTQRGFLWDGGTMSDVGDLGGQFSHASGINNRGQIVGGATTSDGVGHAYLLSRGVMTDIGTLGGAGSGATAINDRGDVVGISDTTDGGHDAFLYTKGVMIDLGTLGSSYSSAFSINNCGQIVGGSDVTDGFFTRHGFIYADGKMTDLNTLVTSSWTLQEAVGINDNGWIVCSAFVFGSRHVFLLKPLAESAPSVSGSAESN